MSFVDLRIYSNGSVYVLTGSDIDDDDTMLKTNIRVTQSLESAARKAQEQLEYERTGLVEAGR